MTPTCKTSIVVTAITCALFKATTKETAKEVARPQGRATLFVVAANGRHFCILVLNRVNVVAVTTILGLHVSVIKSHVSCHDDFMLPRRSYHARLRARGSPSAPPGKQKGLAICKFPMVKAWREIEGGGEWVWHWNSSGFALPPTPIDPLKGPYWPFKGLTGGVGVGNAILWNLWLFEIFLTDFGLQILDRDNF